MFAALMRNLIQNCQLAVGDIGLLKIHVPKLAKLSMDRCSLPDSFRCELPILVGLQTLCLNPVCSIFQALQPIARLDSLQCLELGFGVTMDVDVTCLSSLRRLETLHVANCKLVNLHFLLNSIPLRNLDLRNVELETGLRYASTTLRNLFVDCISLAFPVLAAQNFPCLSLLSFETIDLSQGVSGLEKKDVIEKAQQFSEWVTKGPFEAVPGEEGGPFGIAAPPGFSAAFYCSLLQELLPLRRMLSKTPFLDLRNWCFCEGGLEVLGKLCGGSSKEGICLGFENVRFLASRPMLRLLRVVPSVRSVLIFNDGVLFDDTLPKDVIASLLAAQHAQRHFCINMHFSVTLDEEAVPVFKFLADQWDSVKTDIITPPVYSTLQLRLFPGNVFTYT
ncbi:hypothetical protein DUNSADRAFT_1399 [Dunaliella salina]|uniref:Encoded protein n=1 Tax=Dunaliella salina TaxID=3046 RepID=A0ABQ7GX44_DUNSA|nr:hypothetical protein DUNSADRAFT_1399 [Dunaliella salina]|eukprot:KAF5839171.1 hypothetical protein DUNSADRAFT_1399 [Dunaliella salina]